VVLSNPARVGDKIAADLASCSVNSTRMRPAPGAWEAALASGSYLHAVYSPPRDIALFTEGNQRREMHRVDEILMPLPEGRWARDNLAKIGGKAAAFTKCDPLRLAEIIGEAELGLRDVQPYKSLMDAMQKPTR
jgi:hypothetical protein